MNYLSHILTYLSDSQDTVELYLVPNAPIIERKDEKLIAVSDKTLSAEDVRDTLLALKSYAPITVEPIGREGSFSFGIKDVGRIKVSYITQRGSFAINIVKIPYRIPLLTDILSDTKVVGQLEEMIRLNHFGIILLLGSSFLKVSTFAYSLLQHISKNFQKVILIIEKPISFLMRHEKSLVIQREIGVDVQTFEEALMDIPHINPDLVYIEHRDVLRGENPLRILRLANLNTLILLHSPYSSDEALLKAFGKEKDIIKGILKIEPERDGKLSVIWLKAED